MYEKPIQVWCENTREWIDEKVVDVIDVEEGPQGEDQLTFKCPRCDQQHTSRRVG